MSKAVDNVNRIIGLKVISMDPGQQQDEWGWSKANLGANAILGMPLALAHAGAAANGVPLYQHIDTLANNKDIVLPVPAFNIINGGSHAGNALPVQEFMLLPTGTKDLRQPIFQGNL